MKHFFLGRAATFKVKQTFRFLFTFGTRKDFLKLKQYFSNQYQVPEDDVYLFHSGRTALSLALLSQIPTKKNIDEQIETQNNQKSEAKDQPAVAITALTCYAVVQAIKTAGYRPVYLDIDPATFHFGAKELEKAIKLHPNIKAVIIQNNLGLAADLPAIEPIARKYNLFIVEDLAHSYNIKYSDGRNAGSIGDAVVLSFGKGKSIDASSGGALILRHDTKNNLLKDDIIASQPPKISDSLRDRFYPLFGLLFRIFSYLSIGRLNFGQCFMALLLKIGFIQRSADAELNFEKRLGYWQAKYIYRQISKNQIEGTLLRYPLLVENRSKVLRDLKKAGYYFDEIWYDSPVAPSRYYSKSEYKEEACPTATLVAKHIINLPTHYSNIKIAKAWQIVSSSQVKIVYNKKGQPEISKCTSEISTKANRQSSKSRSSLSPSEWKKISDNYELSNFLQSPRWQKYNELLGRRVILREFGNNIDVLMIIKDAKRGRFLEIPNGPLIDWHDPVIVTAVFSEICKIAKDNKCAFVRFRPALADSPENRMILKRLGSIKASFHLGAEHTVMIDLTRSEDELLSSFRRQTRYEVRRADKLKIKVEDCSKVPNILEEFHQVQLDTARRQNFIPPTMKELEALRQSFDQDLKIYVAFDEARQPIAYGLILIDGIEAEYYEAASTPLNRKLPGAYALQWKIICDLKKLGIKRYNLWGIAPEGQTNHRYSGVTTFKTGFSEERFTYVDAQDISIKPLRYKLNRLVEIIRKKRRHL